MPRTLQQLFDDAAHGRYLAVAALGFSKCYVLGCYRNAHVGRLHKLVGPVDACDCHDPEKVGYALPFAVLHPQPAEEPEQAPEPTADEPQMTREELIAQALTGLIQMVTNPNGDEPSGGKKARLKKPVPKLPPGGIGLPVPPATDPSLKRF